MKRKILFAVAALIILSGCQSGKAETSQQDSENKKNESVSQGNSDSKDNKEETTKTSQESEYSAEKADSVLEELGIKSYDIWSYLRPETGEETEEFLNWRFEENLLTVMPEYREEYKQKKKQKIEEMRTESIYGRYRVEQEEPLIIKVNCKNDTKTGYMSESEWGEKAYAYLSPNGYLFKDGDKWYEILGCGNYKECGFDTLLDSWWEYSIGDKERYGNVKYIRSILYGYDKRDEKLYNEESIKEKCFNESSYEEGFSEEYYTYMCDDLTVHARYRIYDEREVWDGGKQRTVDISFYTMIDEYKAVTCELLAIDDNGIYNETITEEMLREIFTIREYK